MGHRRHRDGLGSTLGLQGPEQLRLGGRTEDHVDAASALAQPLSSWSEGPAKARILAFVKAVTDKSGKDFDANAKGRTVVSVKTDWKRIVPVE